MADMFAPLVAQLKANPKTIVFTEGNDPRILEAAAKLLAEGVLKVVMVGNEAECKAAAAAGNFDISAAEIIDPENYAGFDEMVNTMVELRKGKQTAEECTALLKKSNYFGTMLVKMGKADCLLGGATYSTADTIRPALQLVKTKKGAHLVSSCFILDRDCGEEGLKRIAMGDCAVNIDYTDTIDKATGEVKIAASAKLAEVAIETAKTAKLFGIDPKVAVLSFSTKGSGKGGTVALSHDATVIAKELAPELKLDGEMQFDAAVSPVVGQLKFPGSPVAGHANTFIFPCIEAGNIGYKIAQRLGGFAAYGIYPEYEELYAFHIMYESDEARRETEAYLDTYFMSEKQERIPTEPVASIKNPPDIWRYFAAPHPMRLAASGLDEAEYTMAHVFHINGKIDGAFVASSGKNMGAFKGVGYPEDIGAFYRICDYDAWAWTAHGRFPTNTPGWWGGAHPFTLLNWSVVHNGEISSYDANRRYVEQFGYDCELQTDTEVITYLFDLLSRRHGLTPELAAHIMTAPAWDEIDAMEPSQAAFETALRTTYASALVNGPFSVILGSSEGLLAINDRLKLRALMAAEKGSMVYMASEQAAIELVCPDAENMRAIGGGEPFVVQLDSVVAAKAAADTDAENDPHNAPLAHEVGVLPRRKEA